MPEPITPEPPVPTPAPETPPAEMPAEEPKDRTAEQFDKLKEHNQELKAAKEAAEAEKDKYKNLFEGLKPADVTPEQQANLQGQFPNLNQDDVTKTLSSMVDENGYLDGNKLAQTLKALDDKANAAEQEVQKIKADNLQKQQAARDKEEKQAITDIYAKYPQLNPENTQGVEKDGQVVKFDPKMWQYVYNSLAMKAKAGTMPSETDYMTAADEVYTDLYEGRNVTKKDEEQKKKLEDQKRQINATRPRSAIQAGYFEGNKDEELVAQVRAGKRGAVGALLKRRGL